MNAYYFLVILIFWLPQAYAFDAEVDLEDLEIDDESPILSRITRATEDEEIEDPISPSDYAKDMAQGFATNYFKTSEPAIKYRGKNIIDVYARGFRNLRLRCRADLYDNIDKNDEQFNNFLNKLAK
uniref:Secreted protein n=3 Tax=Clytia hemisphaerica TaxID=252671 RepID=A0A7M5UIX4_9CNID